MPNSVYPPKLGGSIPAAYGDTIKVPFTHNQLVNINKIHEYSLIVKTVATNKQLFSLTTGDFSANSNYVVFNLGDEKSKLKVGQYYKVQLAYRYLDDNNKIITSLYSNVAAMKYTKQPRIAFGGVDGEAGTLNYLNNNVYVGTYFCEDASEKVYNYKFDIYESSGELHESSGWCLHDSSNDTDLQSSNDYFTLSKDLIQGKTYIPYYSVITTNKIELSAMGNEIHIYETIDPELKANIRATNHPDNGYVRVWMEGVPDKDGIIPAAAGSFLIKRASSKDSYSSWNTIYKFELHGVLPSLWSWDDHTVECGYDYKYALQQYNDNNLYSNRIESEVVSVSYDDCFLFDGERQLKIAFNPKITSFKQTTLETKTDTIGSKYPFFFRNNKVGYKEFPISGLISYISDDEELFMSKADLLLDEQTTNLTTNNITAERIFKMEVLNWLNNGKIKLFRSPTEGTFIVRLMNVSLAPNETVGRMLHTFSATAYEVCEVNYQALIDHGFLNLEFLPVPITQWKTIDYNYNPMEKDEDFSAKNILGNDVPATSITFSDFIPGTTFLIYVDGNKEEEEIRIGVTGFYKIDLGDNIKITSLKLKNKQQLTSGSITYSYQSKHINTFDTIQSVRVNQWEFNSFIGDGKDIVAQIEEEITPSEFETFETFRGLKKNLMDMKYVRFHKRPVYDVYEINGEYYWDASGASMLVNKDQYAIFHVVNEDEVLKGEYGKDVIGADPDGNRSRPGDDLYAVNSKGPYYRSPNFDDAKPLLATTVNASSYPYYHKCTILKFIDFPSGQEQEHNLDSYSNQFIINNGQPVDLSHTEYYEVPDNFEIKSLKVDTGLIVECAYLTKEINYNVEQEGYRDGVYGELQSAIQKYNGAIRDCENWFSGTVEGELPAAAVKEARRVYLIELKNALQKEKEARGYYA